MWADESEAQLGKGCIQTIIVSDACSGKVRGRTEPSRTMRHYCGRGLA